MNKVLLIDDDPFILEMYVLKLKTAGFDVEAASSGKEGLERIKMFQPDLLLLDIVMPVMDGFDILQELKKSPPPNPLKIVLLSNLGQKEDIERGLALGANDYIVKANFTPGEVVAKIQSLLAK